MRMAFFLAFLLVALGYAAWRGGGPERAMAAIALTMVGADKMLHAFVPVEFASLDTGHLAIDLFGATATTLLALFAHRSEEHTSELQSLMRISYAVFCLKKKKYTSQTIDNY